MKTRHRRALLMIVLSCSITNWIQGFKKLEGRTASRLSRRHMHHMLRPDTLHRYEPPSFAKNFFDEGAMPTHRLRLANLPTPVHRVIGGAQDGILARLKELNIKLYIKRDDATGGAELGGNKVRKLEMLMCDAIAKRCDSVVTIGGEQSNHCRATAAASRMMNLSPHLILRTRRADAIERNNEGMGYTGNVLFDRMVGSTIYTCTPGEYGRLGSNTLVGSVCDHLESNGFNPNAIPVGGSNALGTWGYISAVEELMHQLETIQSDDSDFNFGHVVFATGSGGTAAGIALGLSLAHGADAHPAAEGKEAPTCHGIGVCDSPDYFYTTIASIADAMGLKKMIHSSTEDFIRSIIKVHHGKGRGYAVSSDEELRFISQFAVDTGICLDPVYSGKALYHFMTKVLEEEPEKYRGQKILFWHTGGALGTYEKGNDLLKSTSSSGSKVKRIDCFGKSDSGDTVVCKQET